MVSIKIVRVCVYMNIVLESEHSVWDILCVYAVGPSGKPV